MTESAGELLEKIETAKRLVGKIYRLVDTGHSFVVMGVMASGRVDVRERGTGSQQYMDPDLIVEGLRVGAVEEVKELKKMTRPEPRAKRSGAVRARRAPVARVRPPRQRHR